MTPDQLGHTDGMHKLTPDQKLLSARLRVLCVDVGGQCSASRMLKVSDRTVRRWIAKGEAPADYLARLEVMARKFRSKVVSYGK